MPQVYSEKYSARKNLWQQGKTVKKVAVQGKLTRPLTYKEYFNVHSFIKRNYVKPRICQVCKKSPERIDWANVTGIYDTNIKSYKAMCASCHRRFDLGQRKGFCSYEHKLTNKNKYTRPEGYFECRICREKCRVKYRRKLKP